MKRACLRWDDKIEILNYESENPKKGYGDIANQVQIEKTATTILKDAKKLRKEYEFFKGNYKIKRTVEHIVISEILWKLYGKDCAGPVLSRLQEEALTVNALHKK